MPRSTDGARGTIGSFPRSVIELPTKSDVVNSVAPNEDLDDDDEDFGRDVSLSNNEEEENVSEKPASE